MKSLFINRPHKTRLELGIEDDNSLNLRVEDMNESFIDFELNLQEAIVFQQEVNKYVAQMKEVHRSKLPWWRIGIV
jgi:hypothetical protein